MEFDLKVRRQFSPHSAVFLPPVLSELLSSKITYSFSKNRRKKLPQFATHVSSVM